VSKLHTIIRSLVDPLTELAVASSATLAGRLEIAAEIAGLIIEAWEFCRAPVIPLWLAARVASSLEPNTWFEAKALRYCERSPMRITRRSWIKAAGAISLSWWNGARAVRAAQAPLATDSVQRFPAKDDFPPMSMTFLDSGGTHPISLGARHAVTEYLAARGIEKGMPHFGVDAAGDRVRSKFASLINAKPQEICLVQSTTAGEHLVLQALGIPAQRGRIVTDTLHFPSSFYLYESMAKLGMDVTWVKPRDGKTIDLADVDDAVNRHTRLVVVSLVSAVNGFQHNLKKVCEIAHARGAFVYADIVQAAGSVPVDVRDSNVDFAACAAYKWLMGDFGLGLLYAREDLLERIKRTQFGYYQVAEYQTHVYPFDPPGRSVADFQLRSDATGHFATGTTSGAGVAQLDYSLDYIRRLGVENIQRYRQPLLDKARTELERLGFQCMTPPGATSPILAFAYDNAGRLEGRLRAANIKVTLVENRIRISPSVFNDVHDIEHLIEVLS
jgi:selenocysteine lyase/cysteine desulfurase